MQLLQDQYHPRSRDGGMAVTSAPSYLSSPANPGAEAGWDSKSKSNDRPKAAACLSAPSAALAPVLAKIHPRLRPWHLYTVLGAIVVVVVVLAVTLVHERDERDRADLVQKQMQVRAESPPKTCRAPRPSLFCRFFLQS